MIISFDRSLAVSQTTMTITYTRTVKPDLSIQPKTKAVFGLVEQEMKQSRWSAYFTRTMESKVIQGSSADEEWNPTFSRPLRVRIVRQVGRILVTSIGDVAQFHSRVGYEGQMSSAREEKSSFTGVIRLLRWSLEESDDGWVEKNSMDIALDIAPAENGIIGIVRIGPIIQAVRCGIDVDNAIS